MSAAPITLRCTGKVLKLLRVPEAQLFEGDASNQDWYANVLWIRRRKCLLITHAGTSFSTFLPDVRAAGLRPIGAVLVPALRAALAAESLPADTFGPLVAVQIAKTADRRVLNRMRELARCCEAEVARAGGLAELDLGELLHRLQRTPDKGRPFAMDLVRDHLGEPPQPVC
jgi:hypothetical protein